MLHNPVVAAFQEKPSKFLRLVFSQCSLYDRVNLRDQVLFADKISSSKSRRQETLTRDLISDIQSAANPL